MTMKQKEHYVIVDTLPSKVANSEQFACFDFRFFKETENSKQFEKWFR